MKVNTTMLAVSFGIGALAGFGFYSGNPDSYYQLTFGIGAGLSMFITLGGAFAFYSPYSPHGLLTNLRIVSILFLIVFLVKHIILSFVQIPFAPYVVITGILLLVYVLVRQSIIKALE